MHTQLIMHKEHLNMNSMHIPPRLYARLVSRESGTITQSPPQLSKETEHWRRHNQAPQYQIYLILALTRNAKLTVNQIVPILRRIAVSPLPIHTRHSISVGVSPITTLRQIFQRLRREHDSQTRCRCYHGSVRIAPHVWLRVWCRWHRRKAIPGLVGGL